MVKITKATAEAAAKLTEVQRRTFDDDNKLKPPGCSMEGPPGYDSVNWNAGWIEKTPYYKILYNGQIVGGIIIFELGEKRYELGRMWVDPDFQNLLTSMKPRFAIGKGKPPLTILRWAALCWRWRGWI